MGGVNSLTKYDGIFFRYSLKPQISLPFMHKTNWDGACFPSHIYYCKKKMEVKYPYV